MFFYNKQTVTKDSFSVDEKTNQLSVLAKEANLRLVENQQVQFITTDAIVTFKHVDNSLFVTIETDDLYLRSVQEQDKKDYYELYGDQDVVRKFHTGKPKTQEETDKYLKTWLSDWNQKKPFSAFAIFSKEKVFVGNIAVDHNGDSPGIPELTYILKKEHWRNTYGGKATSLILNNYLPLALLLNYDHQIRGKECNGIEATVRLDNIASKKILDKYMDIVGIAEMKHGALRQSYYLGKIKLLEKLTERNPQIIEIKKEPIMRSKL